MSGNPYNDSEVCIAIYNPLKHKLTSHRGYPIIVEDSQPGAFIGLRDRYRSAILIKNRFGEADRLVPLNFLAKLDSLKNYQKFKNV